MVGYLNYHSSVPLMKTVPAFNVYLTTQLRSYYLDYAVVMTICMGFNL